MTSELDEQGDESSGSLEPPVDPCRSQVQLEPVSRPRSTGGNWCTTAHHGIRLCASHSGKVGHRTQGAQLSLERSLWFALWCKAPPTVAVLLSPAEAPDEAAVVAAGGPIPALFVPAQCQRATAPTAFEHADLTNIQVQSQGWQCPHWRFHRDQALSV